MKVSPGFLNAANTFWSNSKGERLFGYLPLCCRNIINKEEEVMRNMMSDTKQSRVGKQIANSHKGRINYKS